MGNFQGKAYAFINLEEAVNTALYSVEYPIVIVGAVPSVHRRWKQLEGEGARVR